MKHVEIAYDKSAPSWRVSVVTDGARSIIETHYGDHCDANERRYARERANNIARVLSMKHNLKIIRE